MGYCSSYDELKSVDTSLASEVLAKSEEYGTVLPSNISLGSFVQIAADNNDFNEETLDETCEVNNCDLIDLDDRDQGTFQVMFCGGLFRRRRRDEGTIEGILRIYFD
ncbi:hypothetical protein QZH41_005546 [Actinostola sp. cb2023]|nr:hypothetical protein QZH41_005546 [Actinostola sp. cb2023]